MQFLRIEKVADKVAIQKSEIWARVKKDIFPKPISISDRITAWDSAEIELWMSFKKMVSKNQIKFLSTEEEAEAWSKFQNDSTKDPKTNDE